MFIYLFFNLCFNPYGASKKFTIPNQISNDFKMLLYLNLEFVTKKYLHLSIHLY